MTSKRTVLNQQRKPTFDRETLELFRRLDARRQKHTGFSVGARELAHRLDLVSEFWTGNTPLDRSRRPCHPEGYIAHQHWHRCREVRRALLAAAQRLGEAVDGSSREPPGLTASEMTTRQ